MSARPKPPIAIYSALADACRCRILEMLAAGPLPVHQITGAFSISRPAISRHLRVLKEAGLVAEVKKGRENLYALKIARLASTMPWLQSFSGKTAAGQEKPKRQTRFRDAPSLPAIVPEISPALEAVAAIPPPQRQKKASQVNQMGFDF